MGSMQHIMFSIGHTTCVDSGQMRSRAAVVCVASY